jgi:hypothetical protein
MIQGVIQQLKFMTKKEYLTLIETKVMLKESKIQLHAKVSKEHYLPINLFVYKILKFSIICSISYSKE